MVCQFCRHDCQTIIWREISHVGKRAICPQCLANHDLQRMTKSGSVVLALRGNELVNPSGLLRFVVIETEQFEAYSLLSFQVGKQTWKGQLFAGCDNRVLCKRTNK